ncbi:MAG: zinc-ribbon domain-containing protein [Deltaproteobacteria bacterium]|nr:zinc-ribbon domain-containing protein [Deltaproteobacteria bacterium]
MEVTCPACAARYTADEEKLRGKTARIRCRACDTVWVVSGPEETTGGGEARRVKRGADREHRDLFATREPDLGSVPSTMRPPPPEGVGARNETSVLFTVASLKGERARVKTPEPSEASPPTSMRPMMMDDDEGVIDLHALASVPPKPGTRPVAPLFSEPPPAAFARDATPSSSSLGTAPSGAAITFSKRMMVGIGAAAVAVVLMGIGVAAAFKGEEPVARAQASMAPIPPPTTPPAVAPKAPEPPPAAPVASTSSTSSDDDADAKDAKPSKKGKKKNMSGGGAGAKLASGGGKSPNMSKVASSGVAPVKSKPAADKCGCKGDFNCILRCTATGK